ncbi:MAG: hypothetical protein GX971_00155 [Firmicutes bacterium]|nr:hypothetical protein [Bacillota bacterium]
MDRHGNHVDLFVSILIRFPQICTVHYEPESKTIRLVFLLKNPNRDFQEFVRYFESHLAALHLFSGGDVGVASLKTIENSRLTTIEVTRDFASLSFPELKLIVELITDFYGDTVLLEGPQMAEEDAEEQNTVIESLLTSNAWRPLERLTGFRENGRVLVFSRPNGVSET